IGRTFLFSNPDGLMVILISLQKRQDAPGRSAGRTVSPYRGLSQAVAEGMRSQPAQASPASTGNAAAVGRTEEDRQAEGPPPQSNRPPRSSPSRHPPPRRGPEGRTALASATRGDRPSRPNAPDEYRRETSTRPRCARPTQARGQTKPTA